MAQLDFLDTQRSAPTLRVQSSNGDQATELGPAVRLDIGLRVLIGTQGPIEARYRWHFCRVSVRRRYDQIWFILRILRHDVISNLEDGT